MSWSINDLSRETGVTSRTLRHYDAVGLLEPAWRDPGGRRFYEQEQLLRLQRILLLRELGLGLDSIGEVLAGQDQDSAVEVLRRHRAWLLAELDRYHELVTSVENTMKTLEEGGTMSAKVMFNGFEDNPYEEEARARWGDKAVDGSAARMQTWTPDQAEQARTGFDEARDQLNRLKNDGVSVDEAQVQEVVHGHYQWICLFWTPERDSYKGLADLYYDDERFRQNIGNGDDSLVAYLRDAMKVYADNRLS